MTFQLRVVNWLLHTALLYSVSIDSTLYLLRRRTVGDGHSSSVVE